MRKETQLFTVISSNKNTAYYENHFRFIKNFTIRARFG